MSVVTPGETLILCSKSRWIPAIRREHALAQIAVRHGHRVLFIERPLDLRALRSAGTGGAWWHGLRGRPAPAPDLSGVEVVPHSGFVPGHRDVFAERTSQALLRHRLRRVAEPGAAAIVANVPWQWPSLPAARPIRRVFDCADDWSELMPHRRGRLRELYRRIGAQADAVVVANPTLAEHFGSEGAIVVRNGVADELLTPMTVAPSALRMVHTGTLTPRFDAELVGAVLAALPDWTLDLYGQSQYPRCGDAPGPELRWLLDAYGSQVRWHDIVSRAQLPAIIDACSVAIAPNRRSLSLGQDPMKLYDYAARGRPIVSTRFNSSLDHEGPPHLHFADTPDEMVSALVDALVEPAEWAAERRAWAERQRWDERWAAWSAAVFGVNPPAEVGRRGREAGQDV